MKKNLILAAATAVLFSGCGGFYIPQVDDKKPTVHRYKDQDIKYTVKIGDKYDLSKDKCVDSELVYGVKDVSPILDKDYRYGFRDKGGLVFYKGKGTKDRFYFFSSKQRCNSYLNMTKNFFDKQDLIKKDKKVKENRAKWLSESKIELAKKIAKDPKNADYYKEYFETHTKPRIEKRTGYAEHREFIKKTQDSYKCTTKKCVELRKQLKEEEIEDSIFDL